MHFYIDSKELTEGVLSVIKALPVRTTMPILEGIYLEAGKDGIKEFLEEMAKLEKIRTDK